MSRNNTEETLVDVTDDFDPGQELKVTFYPPLYIQRRLWVLNILRAESVTRVLDVGCGEGQLLSVLCQPAPWLRPSPDADASPDEFVWLHPTHVHGLDISAEDLDFAVRELAPIKIEDVAASNNAPFRSKYTSQSLRWEDLEAKIWKGSLQTINEEFIDIECIVSTEVIEHLPPDIFPAFAPMLLGVYHPSLFLITTPSYTFNARFNSPDAPKSARQGYPDPTSRTDRIFRHDDHKFEWTVEEFETWCQMAAGEWGYEVKTSAVGRALEKDPWGRDDNLGGASQVAVFRRSGNMTNQERERKGREVIHTLGFSDDRHELLASYHHCAHPSSMQSKPLREVSDAVKAKMELFKVSFIRLEEIWFEHDIAILCGGWIEYLVRAVEESHDLQLDRKGGARNERSNWMIELVGVTPTTTMLWPTENGMSEAINPPDDWIPEEETSTESSEWEKSDGNEADVSSCNEAEEEAEASYAEWGFKPSLSPVHWGREDEGGWDSAENWEKEDPGRGWGYTSESNGGNRTGWEDVESENAGAAQYCPKAPSNGAGKDGWDEA